MKFVATDLDGTLLESHDSVSNYTKITIKKLVEKGINFVIATGRGRRSVDKFVQQMGIETYLVCNNGANIYNKEGKLIYEAVIPTEISSEICKTIMENNLNFNLFREDFFYRYCEDKNTYRASNTFIEREVVDLDRCPEANKIIVVDKDPNVIKNISDILKEKYSSVIEVAISQPTCVDISPMGCDKGAGLKHISEIFNVPLIEFMAFGDGENDIAMLNVVGMPIIMENSQDVLREKFKNVTKSNKEDGVADYLTKYFKL